MVRIGKAEDTMGLHPVVHTVPPVAAREIGAKGVVLVEELACATILRNGDLMRPAAIDTGGRELSLAMNHRNIFPPIEDNVPILAFADGSQG